MNFDFSTLGEQSFTSDSQSYLKPYNIYKVKLNKIEKSTIKGAKDPTKEYSVIAIEFGNESGIFSTNLFVPNRPEDMERKENESTHKEQPSNWERFYMTLLQIMEVLNPTGAAKFKELAKSGKIKSVDTFIEVVLKALSGKNTEEAYLKLVGRNNNGTVYSTLPTSCWVDQNTKQVKPLNFISSDESKLTFSAYEIQQMNTYKNAKPTPMNDSSDGGPSNGDDIDLESIEL